MFSENIHKTSSISFLLRNRDCRLELGPRALMFCWHLKGKIFDVSSGTEYVYFKISSDKENRR